MVEEATIHNSSLVNQILCINPHLIMIYLNLMFLYFQQIFLDSWLILFIHDLARQLIIIYYRFLYIWLYTLVGRLLHILLAWSILYLEWFGVNTLQWSYYVRFWWWSSLVSKMTVKDKLLFVIRVTFHISLYLCLHISIVFIGI
jgi:hypothetical protein